MRRWPPQHARPPAQRGAVLVELALVLPLLVVLTLATVEMGQALAAYKRIVSQVRSAARYLSTQSPGTGHVAAECLLTQGVVSPVKPCGGSFLLPGFALPGWTVTVADALNAPATHRAQRSSTDLTVAAGVTMNLVTVSVTGYPHRLNFAGFIPGLTSALSTLTFGPISITMRQAL